jgi:hypothetical protein
MATRTIKPQREDTMLSDYESLPDTAPSVAREVPALASQIALFIGFFLLLVGGLAILAPMLKLGYFVSPGWGFFVLTLGLLLLLIHCYVDPDLILRRIYAVVRLGLIATAAIIALVARGSSEGLFLSVGVPLLLIALFFLIGVLRRETNPAWSRMQRLVLVGAGGIMIFCGLAFGMRSVEYLCTEGMALLLLGLAYVCGYIGASGDGDDSYRAGLGLAGVGALCLVLAIGRSWYRPDYIVPAGLFLGAVGVLYLFVAALAVSDRPVFVLTRRELAGFFYSPIAYLVLFGVVLIFGFNFLQFVVILLSVMQRDQPLFEPVIANYLTTFFTWVIVVVLMPLLTMRSYSEERRTGSLEMLMTAPVTEWSIVLSKFFATYVFFLICWLPLFLFPIAFRVFGHAEFDYRPVLSFFLTVAVTGAAFISIGLFVSSLTSNQIVAAVVNFAVMLMFIGVYFVGYMDQSPDRRDLWTYLSIVDLYSNASRGLLPVRNFALYASIAAFFLYLTQQVLTARKWK